jgi:hypothetical protein
LKEEALDRTIWRNRFGRGVGPVVRQNTEGMNESVQMQPPSLISRYLGFLCLHFIKDRHQSETYAPAKIVWCIRHDLGVI